MSIDLYLRCKKAPQLTKIEEVIFPLGWEKTEYNSRFYKSSYLWFHRENYESLRGCWLFIQEPSEDDPPGTKMVFLANSKAGRSYEDIQAQNLVIKSLRKKFGGSIYDPQEGKCAYIVNDWPQLTPAEKACGLVYIHFQDNISRAGSIIEEIPQVSNQENEYLRYKLTTNKEILRNNTTLPFFVSCWESFLKEFLISYINTRPEVQEKIYEKNTKLEYQKVKELMSGSKTLAEIEVNKYSFQNLNSANLAYKLYTEIDMFDILNKRRRVGRKMQIVRDVIVEMLELRHKIIHSAYIDITLDEKRMNFYLGYLRKAGQLFVAKFLSEKNFRIDLEEYV